MGFSDKNSLAAYKNEMKSSVNLQNDYKRIQMEKNLREHKKKTNQNINSFFLTRSHGYGFSGNTAKT